MKRWKKIVLGVMIVLVVAVAAVCVWQWDNIHAAYLAVSQDSEQIAENAQKKRDEHQQAIQDRIPITVKPPTAEQTDSLLNQKVTPEEVKDELGITELLKQDSQQQEQQEQQGDQSGQKPDQQGDQNSQKPELSEQELINLCLAEMYACKIDMMGVLAQFKQQAVSEWKALPKAERTKTRRLEIGFAGLGKCYELEGTIDEQVRGILARYKERLAAIDGDLTMMDTFWQYYEEEKATEKAYYINKYMY